MDGTSYKGSQITDVDQFIKGGGIESEREKEIGQHIGELRKRLDPDAAAERVYNFLHTLTIECQMMARACGKTKVHSLEPEDLAALTMEASAIAQVPLAGTDFTVGVADYHHI